MTPYERIDTPSLLIDLDRAEKNIRDMQAYADKMGVKLRPHTKTHKMPYFAKKQVDAGACGIAVAKIGEAEVMAEQGITDILIANEIVGIAKYERLLKLHEKITIRSGVDNCFQIDQIEQVFENSSRPYEVLIELEVGENRTGVITDEQLINLVEYIKTKKHVILKGIFSHEGHTYKAPDRETAKILAEESYKRTLRAADLIRKCGVEIEIVSIGATPSIMNHAFMEGITELRLGTYIFMDMGQGKAIQDYSRCAATVLATIISKPTDTRVVTNAGAKALVPQNRSEGICSTGGFGCMKGDESVVIANMFDEHGIIEDQAFHDKVSIGEKVEIIPSHVCPTVNLYDEAVLVSKGEVLETVPILCRGKTK